MSFWVIRSIYTPRGLSTRKPIIPAKTGEVRLEKEIHDFLYKSGANPFEANFQVPKREIGTKRDIFFADCVRPQIGSNKEASLRTTGPKIWEGDWSEYLQDYSSKDFDLFHRTEEFELDGGSPGKPYWAVVLTYKRANACSAVV